MQVHFFIIVYYELMDPVNTERNTLLVLLSTALVNNGKRSASL